MSFLFLYKEQGRIIAPIRHVCSSTKRPDETIFIRHLLIRVGAYAMHTFVQYLRKVCRSECQRANITGDVFATPSLPQPLHGTVVIFNSLFRSLYWRLFDWLQTRAPLSGEGGEGEMEMMRSYSGFYSDFPDSSIFRRIGEAFDWKKSLVFRFLDHIYVGTMRPAFESFEVWIWYLDLFVLFEYLKVSTFFSY